jgi:glutamine amidotransferase
LARSGTSATNGDGFGVGWYDHRSTPGVYKHTQPAWNDDNLRDLCRHVRSPMFLAHVRRTTGTAVQRSNSHPFRHGRWLLVHNGRINQFHRVRRDIAFAIAEHLYPDISGTTDSELMLMLALTFGLDTDVRGALSRMVGYIEGACRRRDIADAVQMTLGLTDGERLYAVRYGTDELPPSLYHSRTIHDLRELVPLQFRARVDAFSPDARAIVSEPLTDLPEPWVEIPASTFLVVDAGEIHSEGFAPQTV